MNQFIIAIPLSSGNRWQHWQTYHVIKTTDEFYLIERGTHFGNGQLWDDFGLAFEFQPSLNLMLRLRLNLVKDYERRYITNGVAKWRKEKIPIRFVSVPLHFASGYRLILNQYEESWEVSERIQNITRVSPMIENRWAAWMNRGGTYKINSNSFDELKAIFGILKHSQVSLVSQSSTLRKKARSLKGLYDAVDEKWGLRHPLKDDFHNLLQSIYPSSFKSTKKAVCRCVERFVRRHPTQATKRLLQMIAGSSSLRHL